MDINHHLNENILLPSNVNILTQKMETEIQHLPDLNGIQIQEEHLDQNFMEPSTSQIQIATTELKPNNHKKETPGKKRNSLTIEKKIEIIKRHEAGETQRALSLEYNVGRTTISDILRRKYKFFKFMSMQTDKNSDNIKKRRTLRRTVHKELEEKLLEWYTANREQGQHISGPMISQKAQELHKELGYTDSFTASNGWLDRFKIRNGIKLCGLREVKTESDENAVAPFKTELESLAQWYNLNLEQIYNADETDLFWKMLPNPEADSNEVKSSVRAYRERMTILCCSNATGSHKLPLVCVGRGKRCRTFTSSEVKQLPVQYYSQETAWMDTEIFRNWFHTQFVPLTRQHLRSQGLPETALLLIDRSPSHPSDQFLRSDDGFFFVQFLPNKVKTLIQPMEQGMIKEMKLHYRRSLLTELISKNLTINEFHRNLTIKDAIRGIANGWDSISEENIRRCFTKLFPVQDNMALEFNAVETTITLDSFAKLIKNIPECVDYGIDRLEDWLNCDEAEPKRNEKLKPAKPEENIIFVDVQHSNTPFQTVIEEASDDDDMIDDDDEIIQEIPAQQITIQTHVPVSQMPQQIQQPIQQQPQQIQQIQLESATTTLVYTAEPESTEITTKQAFDALNVLLKYMKNDSESRYKDVMLLTDLKKKFKKKLSEQAVTPIKMERDFA